MNMGAFGENFPYTNFHDLNLDWIIKTLKEIVESNADTTEKLQQMEQALQEFTEWAEGFIENIPEYVEDGLNDLVEDGTMAELLEETGIEPVFDQIFIGNTPMIVAHQGEATFAPGNTAPAFKQAKYAGYGGFELDIQFTSDNIPVCSHNDTLISMTSQSGNISETELATLQTYTVTKGSHASNYPNLKYCLLTDALQIAHLNNMTVVIDIDAPLENKMNLLYDAIKSYQWAGNNVMLASKSVTALDYFATKPEKYVTWLYQTSDYDIDALISTAIEHGFTGIGVPYSLLQSNQTIINIHNNGLLVEAFGLGWDKQRLQASITRNIDMIVTDGIRMFDNNIDLNSDTPCNKPVTSGEVKGLIYITDFEKEQIIHGGFIRRNYYSSATIEYPKNMNRYSNIRAAKTSLIHMKQNDTINFPATPSNMRLWITEIDSNGLSVASHAYTESISSFTATNANCKAIVVQFANAEDTPITDYQLMDMDKSFSYWR